MTTTDEKVWWQTGIIYQIYPRSFNDSSGNGVGDLHGIIEKLDYLQSLGIDAVWISPIYSSPMADLGYDVSDYKSIDPIFGTMEDFKRLLAETHDRGMKLILDFVPNHTSEEHPWFQEARKSKDNPKRDWYIWKDPKPDGRPPNNWISVFGGSAWELDEKTGQYYYHAYLKEQPDLNWRNPQVCEAMLEAMQFWLEKGVDGFRVDAMWHIIKDEKFRDNPINPEYQENVTEYKKLIPAYSTNQPDSHKIINMMQDLIDAYDETVLIFEFHMPLEELVVYYGLENSGANLPFNFQLIELPWNARQLDVGINEYEGSLPPGSWPNWVVGNHDQSRIATRVGTEQAKIAAILLLTLRGTPIMYYGDELGMKDVDIPDHKILDPREKRDSKEGMGRDPQRTPMQWDGSENAGFTEGDPWLPLMDNHDKVNVVKQLDDPRSILNLYRKLIDLRSKERTLRVGDYFPLLNDGNLLSYKRMDSEKEFIIALNLGDSEEAFTPDIPDWKGIIRLSTHKETEGEEINGEIKLKANQGLIIELV